MPARESKKRFSVAIETKEFTAINSVACWVLLIRDGICTPLGTATMITTGLAFTAQHYITEVIGRENLSGGPKTADFEMKLVWFDHIEKVVHILPVERITGMAALDFAILQVHAPLRKKETPTCTPHLDYSIPSVGTEISVVGFRGSAKNRKSRDGKCRASLHPRIITSLGHIVEVHSERRDSVRLPFPCFHTDAVFLDGMSGGPVFNNATGRIIGIVCASYDIAAGEKPISYAALIWPILGMELDFPRIDLPEKSVYLVYDLYDKKFLSASGWETFLAERYTDGSFKFTYKVVSNTLVRTEGPQTLPAR